MSCTDCAIYRALSDRCEDLEERLAYYVAEVNGEAYSAPVDWGLSEQESLFARLLATRRTVSKTHIVSVLDEESGQAFQSTNNTEFRSFKHVEVLACRVRAKLADFGWIIPKAAGSTYGVLPVQFKAFRDAMRGDGPTSYPAMSKPRVRAA